MNNIVISGRLVKQGDVYTKDDFKVYRSSVACQRDYKDKDGEYVTDFIEISAYGHTATYLEKYSNKGDMVLVQGKLYFDEYTKDGEMRKKAYVRVDNAQVISTGKKESDQVSLQEVEQDADFTEVAESEEDIPF